MPIKKDGSGKRWVEMQLLVPGTPEQLWHALATGPGNTGWFTKTEIDGRVGGVVRFDFGDGTTSTGEVTDWEPPQRFAYVERDWDKDAPPIATEVTITARSGGRCVVRLVHSLFTSSDAWDDQVEGFESGWPGLFEVLRVYLANFAGQQCECFWAMQQAPLDQLSAWRKLSELVGLTGASVGEPRSGTFGSERWSGVVEHVHQDAKQRYFLVRLTEPRPGIVLCGTYGTGETTRVSFSRYFYGDDAEAQAAHSEPALRAWLSSTFAS
jgi:uncharacterized protein YndB with AHSA1/START domain